MITCVFFSGIACVWTRDDIGEKGRGLVWSLGTATAGRSLPVFSSSSYLASRLNGMSKATVGNAQLWCAFIADIAKSWHLILLISNWKPLKMACSLCPANGRWCYQIWYFEWGSHWWIRVRSAEMGLLISSEQTLWWNLLTPRHRSVRGTRLAWCFFMSAAVVHRDGGGKSGVCSVFDASLFSSNSNRGASLGSHSKPTFLCLGLFLFFLYFFLFYLSKQTHVFVSSLCFLFLFLVGLFFQGSAKASYAPLPTLSTPSFLTHVWIISMRYFWVLFNFHMTVESVQLLFVYYSYSLMIS